MRILQILTGALIVLGLGASAVTAQTAIPEYRYVYTPDTDFYGADLGQLFDTTQAACARACDAQSSCIGFTYNTRSNACFPKSAVTRSEYFEGAQSARKQNCPAGRRVWPWRWAV
ncbi:MAG: PAN/Apple domain-containing protein [Sulfitobacter sp.]|nr:PAN/Apple domain-containing protein [Sulfitobacter sp.]